MKTLLLAGVAALGLTFGLAPQDASAAWAYRTVSRWDPACGHYVTCRERYWVPDCKPCPGPVVHHGRHHGGYHHHHR